MITNSDLDLISRDTAAALAAREPATAPALAVDDDAPEEPAADAV